MGRVKPEQLWAAFQAVINLHTGDVMGHQAYLRGPRGSAMEPPREIFAWAQRTGLSQWLELTAREVVQSFADQWLPNDQWLWMTVVPEMGEPARPAALRYRTAIKVSYPVKDYVSWIAQVQKWRQASYAVAIELTDTSLAHPVHLIHLKEIEATFVKIPATFFETPLADEQVRPLIDQILATGTQVIAYGLETPAQCSLARQWGASWGQGFILASPHPEPLSGRIRLPIAPTEPNPPIFDASKEELDPKDAKPLE